MLKRFATLFVAALAVALTVAMVQHPAQAFQAAVDGLELWWNVVFPALLPFFVVSELLLGLGVVHFLGVLLESLMRPLFRVPGEGAFVLAMGLASGYPIGAVLTAELRRQGSLSREEGERLMSFSNTADPLFMTGAVSVGMFGNGAFGPLLMAAHYISSLLVGLLLRFYRPSQQPPPPVRRRPQPILSRALQALEDARRKDGRPLGTLLGEAVQKSVSTLGLVGGFIILFAVLLRILSAMGALHLVTALFTWGLGPLGLVHPLAQALSKGIFEVTLGSQQAAKAAASLPARLTATSAVIAWSGLSVLAQVAAVIRGTDLRLFPFIIARLLQAILAAILTFLLYPVLLPGPPTGSLPVFLEQTPVFSVADIAGRLEFLGGAIIIGLAGLLLLAAAVRTLGGRRG